MALAKPHMSKNPWTQGDALAGFSNVDFSWLFCIDKNASKKCFLSMVIQ
jgi:hypothetical protein